MTSNGLRRCLFSHSLPCFFMRVLRHNMPTSADILELLWFPMACQWERVFFYPVYSDSGSVVDPDPDPGARTLAESKKKI
jgi:hypothetical protein